MNKKKKLRDSRRKLKDRKVYLRYEIRIRMNKKKKLRDREGISRTEKYILGTKYVSAGAKRRN